MFVAKYPDFLCQVLFKDGSKAFFDGAKDMFKYTHHLSRYNPGKNRSDIQAVFVTDYYDLVPIDGMKAYYVTGSTVYGPMGKELIPFVNEEAANEFLVDHSGSSILRYKDVTLETLKSLD
jgi:nitrous oxide reductase accessory protein NosL